MPLITLKNSPVVDKMNMTGCPLPNCSEVLLPRSPETVGFKDQDVSSAPLSPNRIKKGHSQDMPAEGSIFDVSPDLPGYSMRPAGGGLQLSDTAQTRRRPISLDSIPWSTAEDIIRDIAREGPFDANDTPMDTEESPLISTGQPGWPYRMASYAGTTLADADETYGLQLHHPRFLEFIGIYWRLLNHHPRFLEFIGDY